MSAKDELQQPDVVAYLRGELGPVETVRFERALASSDKLREELEGARQSLGMLEQALPDEAPPASLRERVFERVATESQLPRLRPSLKELAREVGPRRRTRAVLFALAAAASMALALVLGWQTPEEETEERLPVATLRWSHGEVALQDLAPEEEPENPPWQASQREAETGEAPLIFAGQRIATQRGSYAECELGERTRILLDERTTLSVLEAQTPDEADWLWLERGVAHFDVADRQGSGTTGLTRPFVVFTRHGEVRVRGTRFLVRSTDEVTFVAVLNGRVDAFAVPRHGEARPMEPVTSGQFAAIGSRESLRAALPADFDFAAFEAQPPGHDEEVGARGAPEADPAHPVIVAAPLLDVAFEVDTPRIGAEQPGPVWARVTLRNLSPFKLHLLHTGEDNLMLHHRGTAPDVSPWSPVRALRLTLEPGESYRDGVSLPRVLYEHEAGPYYVSAVYTGVVEVEASLMRGLEETAAWPVARNGEPYHRTALFESRSTPVSIVYRRGEDEEAENDEDD